MMYTLPNNNQAEVKTSVFHNGLKEIKKNIKYSINDLIKYLELEIFKYNRNADYKASKIAYCEDEYGNPYVFVEFNPYGTLLMSLINNETVLINPTDEAKRIENLNSGKTYSFNYLTYKFNEKVSTNKVFKSNQRYRNFKANLIDIKETIDNEKLNSSKKALSFTKPTTFYYKDSHISSTDPAKKLIYADKEVPHSWWFKGLKNKFGYSSLKEDWDYYSTDKGLCHYIASGILLQYAQLFLSNQTLSTRQLERYITIPNKSEEWRVKG